MTAAGELAAGFRLSGVTAAGENSGELFVLPSGCLCRIPLELLPLHQRSGGRAVGVRQPMVYLPSWQFLRRSGGSQPIRAGRQARFSASTDSPSVRPAQRLPWAEEEVAHGARALELGQDRAPAGRGAGGRAARALLSGPDWTIVHLATHMEVDEGDPWRSRLLLAPEGPSPAALTVRDLAEGVWRSNLVVLSGCATGRGRVFRGEGAISLARSCLASGSRAVLTTLWPVADRAAGEFMRHFYDALPRCGGQAALALREARRQMRRDPAFRDAVALGRLRAVRPARAHPRARFLRGPGCEPLPRHGRPSCCSGCLEPSGPYGDRPGRDFPVFKTVFPVVH